MDSHYLTLAKQIARGHAFHLIANETATERANLQATQNNAPQAKGRAKEANLEAFQRIDKNAQALGE